MHNRIRLPCALILVARVASAETPGDAPPLVDPMRPLLMPSMAAAPADPSATAPIRHRLSAIRFEATHRFAIVDGTHVAEGDSLGSAKVLKILADEVVIGTDREIQRLRLTQHVIKKPAVAGAR
jgi:hypothetical protein